MRELNGLMRGLSVGWRRGLLVLMTCSALSSGVVGQGAPAPWWRPLWLPEPPVTGVCPGCTWKRTDNATSSTPISTDNIGNLASSSVRMDCTNAGLAGAITVADMGFGSIEDNGSGTGTHDVTLVHLDLGPCSICPQTAQIAAITQPSLVMDARIVPDADLLMEGAMSEDFTNLNNADNLVSALCSLAGNSATVSVTVGAQIGPTGAGVSAGASYSTSQSNHSVPQNTPYWAFKKTDVKFLVQEQLMLQSEGKLRARADGIALIDTASAQGVINNATHATELHWRCRCRGGSCNVSVATAMNHKGPFYIGNKIYVPPSGERGTSVFLPASGFMSFGQPAQAGAGH
ncbi:MAG: hypothetical protein EXS14_08780 [Planctomycetes bacterium]|nr:hypothetical protein [Planctomycetota bacterium]